MARYLVTGGAGFIGSHLVDKLIEEGHKVTSFDLNPYLQDRAHNNIAGDIRDRSTVEGAVEKVDGVFHLAGVLGTSELIQNPVRAEEINVIGTLNVLEACSVRGVPLVFVSKLNPPDWVNPYTITKRACDGYCRMYAEVRGLNVCVIKPYNVYGPRQHARPVQKYVPTFIDRALKDEPIPVWGTGKQEVDPIYVEDTVKALALAIEKGMNKTIEVGTGKPVRVLDVARKVVELTGSGSGIEFMPMRSGEPEKSKTRLYADTRRMRKFLGMNPEDMVTLDDGLARTIDWWRSHPSSSM